MNNIQWWARCAMSLSVAYAGFACITMLITWLGGINLDFYMPSAHLGERIPQMPFAHRILGLLVDSIGVIIIFACVFLFTQLMQLCRKGLFFSTQTLASLSQLSRWALAWAIYNPIRYALLTVITSWHFPIGSGKRELAIMIGSSDFINIFIIGCIVIVTALIKAGYALQQERDLTI